MFLMSVLRLENNHFLGSRSHVVNITVSPTLKNAEQGGEL